MAEPRPEPRPEDGKGEQPAKPDAGSADAKPADDQARDKPPAEGQQPPDKPKKPNPLKNPKVLIIGGIVVVVLAIGALLYWLHARHYENTDDAFVDTHIVRLAPQISGQVSRVLVDDNVLVTAGQPLVEIDASSARATLDQALAQRADGLAKLAQAQAQIAVSQAAYRQARDQAASLGAQADSDASDAARLRGLQANAPRAVAAQLVDQAVAKARASSAQRDAARQQTQGAAGQVAAAQSGIASANATLKSADAIIAENRLTLGHTEVVAPVEGYVTQKSVAPGAYVQPGQQLLAIVPRQMWVTANFKETQLKLMRVGQPVDIKIDACPADLQGKVASIQRGAGQAFALLPSENATGNFVKVVQRVPVKITFEDVPRNCPLGPGLSVRPRVKVR